MRICLEQGTVQDHLKVTQAYRLRHCLILEMFAIQSIKKSGFFFSEFNCRKLPFNHDMLTVKKICRWASLESWLCCCFCTYLKFFFPLICQWPLTVWAIMTNDRKIKSTSTYVYVLYHKHSNSYSW